MSISDIAINSIIIIVGFVVCFGGFKLFRTSITILGGFMGYNVGVFVTSRLTQLLGIQTNETVNLIIIVVMAIAFAVLSFSTYKSAIIYLTTLAVAYYYSKITGVSSTKVILTGLVIGLVIGVLIFIIQKYAIILATSYAGAHMIASTAMVMLLYLEPLKKAMNHAGIIVIGEFNLSLILFVQIVLTVFFFVAGFMAQIQGD